MTNSTTFLASFPPIQSAIKIAGNGDGMRIQLDIPETEMGAAMHITLWRQQGLKVTIEPVENTQGNTNERRVISR